MKKKSTVKKGGSKKNGWEDCRNMNCNNCGGWFYFLGIIGAAIYYLQNSTGFWASILALLKALIWPVFVVLKILGM